MDRTEYIYIKYTDYVEVCIFLHLILFSGAAFFFLVDISEGKGRCICMPSGCQPVGRLEKNHDTENLN